VINYCARGICFDKLREIDPRGESLFTRLDKNRFHDWQGFSSLGSRFKLKKLKNFNK
jgi:hypothetical protein